VTDPDSSRGCWVLAVGIVCRDSAELATSSTSGLSIPIIRTFPYSSETSTPSTARPPERERLHQGVELLHQGVDQVEDPGDDRVSAGHQAKPDSSM
jgi:hypothetical protein